MRVIEAGLILTLFFIILVTIWGSFLFVTTFVSIIFASVGKGGIVIFGPIAFPLVVILVIITIRPAVIPVFSPFPTSDPPATSGVIPIACLSIIAFTPASREVSILSWLDHRQRLSGGHPVLSLKGLL